MDLPYRFSQAQLLPCLPTGGLGDLILECMLSQGIIVEPVAHIWPPSPFWLAVALQKLPMMQRRPQSEMIYLSLSWRGTANLFPQEKASISVDCSAELKLL